MGNTEKPIKTFKPKMSAMNLKVELYSDRFIFYPLMQQPSTVFIKDIETYSITSAGMIKSILHIFGKGMEIFNIELPYSWANQLMEFMKEVSDAYKQYGKLTPEMIESMNQPGDEQKFYYKWWFVILTIIIFPPIGLILLLVKIFKHK